MVIRPSPEKFELSETGSVKAEGILLASSSNAIGSANVNSSAIEILSVTGLCCATFVAGSSLLALEAKVGLTFLTAADLEAWLRFLGEVFDVDRMGRNSLRGVKLDRCRLLVSVSSVGTRSMSPSILSSIVDGGSRSIERESVSKTLGSFSVVPIGSVGSSDSNSKELASSACESE